MLRIIALFRVFWSPRDAEDSDASDGSAKSGGMSSVGSVISAVTLLLPVFIYKASSPHTHTAQFPDSYELIFGFRLLTQLKRSYARIR